MKKNNEFSQDDKLILEDFGEMEEYESMDESQDDNDTEEDFEEDMNEEPVRKKSKKHENENNTSVGKEVLSWVITFAVAIALALVLRNYVLINANVPTGSMESTIATGSDMFGYRLAYLKSDPERGDIIIFKFPDNETEKYVKRIIGLPGETVTIKDGKIYIDDATEPLEENYLKEDWVKDAGPYVFQVPEDSYFVMGDNRNNSYDSRYWNNTFVARDKIIGKALFIYYPFKDMGLLN